MIGIIIQYSTSAIRINIFMKHNHGVLLHLADFILQETSDDDLMAVISCAWYNDIPWPQWLSNLESEITLSSSQSLFGLVKQRTPYPTRGSAQETAPTAAKETSYFLEKSLTLL